VGSSKKMTETEAVPPASKQKKSEKESSDRDSQG
jgi:hypothetical protein